MKANELLKEFRARLTKEAVINSLLYALLAGSGVLCISALVCYFTSFSGWWILPVLFFVSAIAAGLLFYFLKFRPNDRMVARRLDKLGLDERVLTMIELEGKDDYMAKRQREDTVAALAKVNKNLVKMAISLALIIAAPCVTLAALSTTTVYGLGEAGIIRRGKDVAEEWFGPDPVQYKIVYRVSDPKAGVLYSLTYGYGAEEIELKVNQGENSENILPVAGYGYVFVSWSDGLRSVDRTDKNVRGDIVVTAIFEEIDFEKESDELNLGGSQNNSVPDPDSRAPSQSGDPADPSMPQDPGNGGGTGGHYSTEADKVFDGATDYTGAPYEDALIKALEQLLQDTSTDEATKQAAFKYLESLGRGGAEGSN